MGFKYATLGGLSVSISDIVSPPDKETIVKSAQEKVDKLEEGYNSSLLSPGERYNKIIDV
jgi:DNA-directed RNA polymerase subunit beta'